MFDGKEFAYDKSKEEIGKSTVGYQDVNVCVPVTVKPFGEVGNAKTKCLGETIVTPGCEFCPGKPHEVCKFTISQKLRVEIPVVFGAKAEVGEASIDCKCSKGLCEAKDFDKFLGGNLKF